MPRHSNDSRELGEEDLEFLRHNANIKKLYGKDLAVGMFATATNPGVVDNAVLEGDDIGNFSADGKADFRRTSRNDGVTK